MSQSVHLIFLAERISLHEHGVEALCNAVSRGSCSFEKRKINFSALDNVQLPSLGIYGNKEQIVSFLKQHQLVDSKVYVNCYRLLSHE